MVQEKTIVSRLNTASSKPYSVEVIPVILAFREVLSEAFVVLLNLIGNIAYMCLCSSTRVEQRI
jgi:hypothetical protein